MNAFFAADRLSQEEKENILSQHRTIYDGYRTIQSSVPNQQPLYVQDFAKDKVGAVLNNKGVAKPYTNVGINEQVESKEVCDECGSMMMEGECTECGWKGEVGAMEEEFDDVDADDVTLYSKPKKKKSNFDDDDFDSEYIPKKQTGIHHMSSPHSDMDFYDDPMSMEGKVSESTGKLSDIYNVEDLGDSDFDYVEGGGNDYGTFEKMHHMKKIKSEGMYEDPDNEDDGFEDLQAANEIDEIDFEKGKKYKYKTPSFSDEVEFEMDVPDDGEEMMKFKGKEFHHLLPKKSIHKFIDKEIDEQGYTGGGNAPDMDVSNVKPAYDFVSNGPDDVYPTEGEMDEEECDECYEKMESAWEEEVEEQDISGAQGIYGDMDPAYDFDSEGPGKAGPYQHSSWNEQYDGEDEDVYHEKDLEPGELDFDIEKFNPRDKSWEEIKAYTGNWDEIDEDIRESFITKKNEIMEMMSRMKVLK